MAPAKDNLAGVVDTAPTAMNVMALQHPIPPNGPPPNPLNGVQAGAPNVEIHDVDTLLVIVVGLATLLGTGVGIIAIRVPSEVHDVSNATPPSMPKAWLRLWGILSLSFGCFHLDISSYRSNMGSMGYINRRHLVIKRVVLGFLAFFLVLVFCAMLKLAPVTTSGIISATQHLKEKFRSLARS